MGIPKKFLLYYSIMLLTVCGVHVSSQCLEEESSLLLSLKASLTFSSSYSTKLVTWNQSLDCCYHWKGVACSEDGRVVGLDLSEEWISDGLNDSSSLFGLGHLKSLNLAYNQFIGSTQIPSRLDELVNLTYLNLSSVFYGQIPSGISRLRNLVVLDLSYEGYIDRLQSMKLENPNLRRLVQNLSELQELHLDGVNISMSGEEWGQALSSSLPKLRVLSLSYCSLRGPIHSSLSKLTSLTSISLDLNDLSAPVPSFFDDFKNLTTLRISDAGLHGVFPEKVFQMPALQSIDLSENHMLQGSLPEFSQNGRSLQWLILANTNFSGRLPDSIGALRNLLYLDLRACSFSGLIPESLSNLTQLTNLYLSDNSFFGSIFPLSNLTQLYIMDLSNNYFSGSIPSFSQSGNLMVLTLSNNNLSGSILNSTHWQNLSQLTDLHLENNSLTGTIPSSLFSLPFLGYIDLSHNRFTAIGTADDGDGFTNQSSSSLLDWLDLSSNGISGKIPGNLLRNLVALQFLNLSYNSLEDLGSHYFSNSYHLDTVDLSHNRLQGEVPDFPPGVMYLDYSVNNFNSVIPDSVGTNHSDILFFSLANNNLQGNITESICNASSSPRFEILDLSNNSLSGSIPPCLIMLKTANLDVLNLRMNNLSGTISNAFPANCSLRTLNLNGNHLGGYIPLSLANCRYLEVLDLGNNQFSGTFPCGLQQIFNLSVLILRSNKFKGEIGCLGANDSWPLLQIVDVAANSFSGSLKPSFFGSWTAMMTENAQSQSVAQPIGYQLSFHNGYYYKDSVIVIAKGYEMKLEKILTIFTSIDFSNNLFEGNIPGTIGQLKSLVYLNFSHNAFTGQIPISFGNLAQLESLDMSSNQLTGRIPDQLSGLNYLSSLMLSHNRLEGLIPKGKQFDTFTAESYAGNKALCGAPLSTKCKNENIAPPSYESEGETSETNWGLIAAEIGFTVGLGLVIGPLVFWRRWRIWYYERVDRILLILFFSGQGLPQPNHPRRRPGN